MRDGDPHALEALCERRGASVLAYCTEVCAPDDADRAAAEAFARFRAAVVAIDDVGSIDPEALLLSATRHAAASMPRDPATAPRRRLRRPSRAGSGEECRGIPELLAARAEGMLGAEEQALLTRHLARCPACSSLRDAFRRAEAAYREPPERVVPQEAADTIVAALVAAAPVAEAAPSAPAEDDSRPRRRSRRRGAETLEFPTAANGSPATSAEERVPADDVSGPQADHDDTPGAHADEPGEIQTAQPDEPGEIQTAQPDEPDEIQTAQPDEPDGIQTAQPDEPDGIQTAQPDEPDGIRIAQPDGPAGPRPSRHRGVRGADGEPSRSAVARRATGRRHREPVAAVEPVPEPHSMARTPRRPRPPAVAPAGERSHLRAVVLPTGIIAVAIAGALGMAGVFGEDEAPPTSPSSDQLFPTAVIRAPERGTAAAAAAEIARQAQRERLRIARERAARGGPGSTAAVPQAAPATGPTAAPGVPPAAAAAAGPSSATATPTPATSATATPTPILP